MSNKVHYLNSHLDKFRKKIKDRFFRHRQGTNRHKRAAAEEF
jgi:hypothetical protein